MKKIVITFEKEKDHKIMVDQMKDQSEGRDYSYEETDDEIKIHFQDQS